MQTEEDTADAELQIVRPPLILLVLAGASVALSGALLFLHGLVAGFAGYFFASMMAIALVGFFRRTDLQRRQSALYLSRRGLSGWAAVIAAVGVGVSAVHTWSIATALAK